MRPLVDGALLAFNFTVGVATLLSPCGFPMLPAYLAFYLEREGMAARSWWRSALHGLGGGVAAALGAFVTLGAIAFLAQEIGRPFKENVLLIELVGGLVLIGLGAATLAGRNVSFALPVRAPQVKGFGGLAAFGALYAGVSAGCTAPFLLGVVFGALAQPTRLDAALAVGAYGAGMFLALVAFTVAIAVVGASAARPLRAALPKVKKAMGVLLVVIGVYLVAYWWTGGAIGLYVPTPSF